MIALTYMLASAAAFQCAPVTTRRSTALNLAPRHVLEAEFAAKATDGSMDLETAKNTKQIAAELAGGNLDIDELEELWGPGSRDVDGFVGVCRSIDDFFEKDGIEEVSLTSEPEGATVGERLRRGEVVLRVEGACSLDDCNFLYGRTSLSLSFSRPTELESTSNLIYAVARSRPPHLMSTIGPGDLVSSKNSRSPPVRFE